ncbi:MAG: hypothetical protein EBX52_13065, partial [Proteobacteria bacterium]|nr:hypothetical protein [Pseudomonadota bacterium]
MSDAGIFVRNPHSILLALQHRPKDVLGITLPRDQTDGVWREIMALAERSRVKMGDSRAGGGFQGARDSGRDGSRDGSRGGRSRDRDSRDENQGRESGHGAMIRPKNPVSLEKMFAGIDQDTRGLWLALDCLQDPQNVGAIFRSAGFFGVKGIVMTTERSAPMTAVTYDISCGGVEVVPFVQVVNLKQALDHAKEAGLWILGTSEHA